MVRLPYTCLTVQCCFLFDFMGGKVTSVFQLGLALAPTDVSRGRLCRPHAGGTRWETSSFASKGETRGEAGEHGTWEREQQSSVAGSLVLASFSEAKTWRTPSWPSSGLRGRKNHSWECPPGKRATLTPGGTLAGPLDSPARR